MEYNVTNNTGIQCRIQLVPENDKEIELMKMVDEEYTFHYHYQRALESKVNKDAVLVSVLDQSNYPNIVTVKYQISKGLGNY